MQVIGIDSCAGATVVLNQEELTFLQAVLEDHGYGELSLPDTSLALALAGGFSALARLGEQAIELDDTREKLARCRREMAALKRLEADPEDAASE